MIDLKTGSNPRKRRASNPSPGSASVGWVLCIAALVLVAGCSTAPVTPEGADAAPEVLLKPPSARDGRGRPVESSPTSESQSGDRYELVAGSGDFIDADAAARPPEPDLVDGKIIFNFEGESLQEVVAAILGDVLGENYVIAPGVSGTVTFSTAKPVGTDQVLPVLEMLLSWNNAALVYFDGRYHVMPKGQAIPGQLTPTVDDFAGQKGYEVRVFPLDFISPTEMEKLLKPYAREGAFISIDNARGMLVMAGTRQELLNYQRTINIFDVDWLAGMSVGIFPLERVEAGTVVTELEAVFGEGAGTPLAGMFRFMPIERLNAVLVITPQADYLEKAGQWVERLDRGGGEAGVRLYVYAVRNVKATDLADTLSDVFGDGGGSRRSDRDQAPGGAFAPGIQTGEITSINDPRRERQQQQAGGDSDTPRGGQRRGSGGDGVTLSGTEDVRITAVEETNSLLIRATPGQYDAVLGAIKRLDVVPLQVLVEVKVLQVKLNDTLRYGVQWFFESALGSFPIGDPPGGGNGDGNGTGGSAVKGLFDSDASLSSDRFGQLDGPSGLTYRILGGDTAAIVTALESATDVRAIAAPSMMVLNNREANINVGTQIPVNSPVFNTGAGNDLATTRVQFRDTGVTMNVVPRVNPGGMVFLEIRQEVSSPSGTSDVNGNVAVDQTRLDTEIAVQSGETIVLGGLIRASVDKSNSGLPFLARVPILGGLFGNQGEVVDRTELLVFITPTVVGSIEEAREVSREYSNKMKAIQPFDLSQFEIDRD